MPDYHRRVKVGRTLLAALLLVLVSLTLSPAASAQDGDLLDVVITEVSTPTISLSTPTQEIRISGTLVNDSTQALSYVNVHFWRLPEPILTTDRLEELTGSAQAPTGSRLFSEPDGNLHNLTGDGWLQPGEIREFTVRASVAQLTEAGADPMTQNDAAYLVGVQVRAIPETGGNKTVGRAMIPVAATQEPVKSSSLVVLSAAPSWLPDGRFLDNSLAEDLTGRLETLLAAGERDGVITAIDPALYSAVSALSRPHTVGGVEADGSGIALRWVSRVDELAAQQRLWVLPYGNPNLERAAAMGALDAVLAGGAVDDKLAGLPTVAVVNHMIPALPRDALETLVVRNATGSVPGTPRVLASTAPGVPATVPDGVRSATLIARELLAASPPLYLIDTVELAAADTLGGALRVQVPPSTSASGPLRTANASTPAPWPNVTTAITEAKANAQFITALTGQAPEFDEPRITALSLSDSFRDEAAAVAYVQAASPESFKADGVELKAASSFVMSAADSTFPATITNSLPLPVVVGVQFDSEAPQRISVANIEPVTVPAGESMTVVVSPHATANGITRVEAQLVTVDGDPLGEPTQIEVTATDFGRVGWLIIVVSGAVVVGGTALRILAVRREQRAKENSEPSQ